MSIELEWWGSDLPYREAWDRQHRRREALLAGAGSACLALLEHRSVLTVGRRPAPGTPSPEELAELGIEFFRAERGGLATWHGPGQLVGYLICDVWALGLGAKSTICAVEMGLIHFLGQLGVEAERREGYPGVWVAGRKIAAVGMHFKRGHSMHGFALNLRVDEDPWSHFTPCGIEDAKVVSLHQLTRAAPAPRAACDRVGRCVLAALHPGA